MRRGGGLKGRRVAALVAGSLLLLLVVAQFVLPRIAAGRIESKLDRYGHVISVKVSAWPAVKLLWGDAGSILVHASKLALSPAQAASLLWEARGLGRLGLFADSLKIGSLQLARAQFSKHGEQLEAQAHASGAAVQAALPPATSLHLLRSAGGQVEVQAHGELLGLGADVTAVAAPEQGKLMVRPVGALFAGLRLTLFSDPHVHITGVAAEADGGGGYQLSIDGLLH